MHKILFCNKFIICLYMFRALCAYHQEVKIVLYSVWYHHTCRWPSRPVHGTATYRCDDTRFYDVFQSFSVLAISQFQRLISTEAQIT